MDKVVIPTEADFEEFRTFCVSEDGWNEVYKDDEYKVWTRKVRRIDRTALGCAIGGRRGGSRCDRDETNKCDVASLLT